MFSGEQRSSDPMFALESRQTLRFGQFSARLSRYAYRRQTAHVLPIH